jgi:hypothetical protein
LGWPGRLEQGDLGADQAVPRGGGGGDPRILTADAPVDGPWSDKVLTNDTGGTLVDAGEKGGGHGLFVVNWMRE